MSWLGLCASEHSSCCSQHCVCSGYICVCADAAQQLVPCGYAGQQGWCVFWHGFSWLQVCAFPCGLWPVSCPNECGSLPLTASQGDRFCLAAPSVHGTYTHCVFPWASPFGCVCRQAAAWGFVLLEYTHQLFRYCLSGFIFRVLWCMHFTDCPGRLQWLFARASSWHQHVRVQAVLHIIALAEPRNLVQFSYVNQAAQPQVTQHGAHHRCSLRGALHRHSMRVCEGCGVHHCGVWHAHMYNVSCMEPSPVQLNSHNEM
jgi:hypothetical protein